MPTNDTIFALSSGALPAAIAVMRVSGPAAGPALSALTGHRRPAARRAALRTVRTRDGVMLDRALVLWLPGPATATGEDVAEFHLHGGRATVAAVDAALQAEGLRPARAGEFTRRALEHGRIDMAQAEGLADLLAAETEGERRAALATTDGALSRALQGWYDQLTHLSALIEARLDHADEDDVVVDRAHIDAALGPLREEIAQILARPTVERLRDGPTIVLAGPPNSGKSSLFNSLVERDAAIVTPVAGTTRDVLDVSVARNGRPYRLMDTAGLHVTDDAVEQIGIKRARQAAAGADLIIWLGDEPPADASALWINARCDLPMRADRQGTAINVSVHDAASIDALWLLMQERLGVACITGEFLLSQRQREGVSTVAEKLIAAAATDDDLVMSEHLRLSLRALDQLVGRNAPEEVFDVLFRRFCIGK